MNVNFDLCEVQVGLYGISNINSMSEYFSRLEITYSLNTFFFSFRNAFPFPFSYDRCNILGYVLVCFDYF
jgi:hypothetical protein